MAYSVCLQDWITVTGGNSTTVTQPETDWIQIPSFQDVAFYTEVGSITNANTTNLDIQTSPTKDEVFFGATLATNAYMARYALTSASGLGMQTVQIVRWATATGQAPARYVRWKIAFPGAGGPTNITFRIWLSLNQAGWR